MRPLPHCFQALGNSAAHVAVARRPEAHTSDTFRHVNLQQNKLDLFVLIGAPTRALQHPPPPPLWTSCRHLYCALKSKHVWISMWICELE